MWSQSILLTLWLLKSPLTRFGFLGSLPSPVWFLGIILSLLESLYTAHLVCFLGIPAVLCTPVAVLCGVTGHVSLAGHHNLPWGRVPHTLLHWCFRLSCWRCEGHRVVWRALLLRNLYKRIRMRAFMCMCLTLFLSLFSATPCTVIALSPSFLPVSG